MSGCYWPQPKGWYCKRNLHDEGPCACVPKWWNLRHFKLWLEWH